MKFSPVKIKKTVQAKGYSFFERGNYNLNIVGIRNSDSKDKVTNKFDDLITVTYLIDGVKIP